MSATSAMYGIAAVERMTGVSASRIRQWHDAQQRSGSAPRPSGLMLYSRDDIAAIVSFAQSGTQGPRPDAPSEPSQPSKPSKSAKPSEPATTKQPAKTSAAGADGHSSHETRLLILLAERDEYAAELSEYFLRTEGYTVETVFDSTEALERYEQLQPDLTIVDLLLDGGAGFELCHQLSALGRSPVVAVSPLDPQGHPALAQVDAVLLKPLAPLALVSTVRDLLGTSAIVRQPEH